MWEVFSILFSKYWSNCPYKVILATDKYKETGKKYVTEKLGFITPFNTFSETELPNDPLAKEISRYMKDESVKNIPWAFTAFPSEAFKKDVGSALLDYVQGEKKWEDVKKVITDKWKSERG